MRSVLYPGSFDPVTVGHMDLIRRASALFERVVVGVLHNTQKPLQAFSIEQRISLLQEAASGLINVEVCAYSGLLVDAVRQSNVDGVLRGLRAGMDFDMEQQMARLNRQMAGVETVFLAASPSVLHISASMVREVGRLGGDLRGLVPDSVRERITDTLGGRSKEGETHG